MTDKLVPFTTYHLGFLKEIKKKQTIKITIELVGSSDPDCYYTNELETDCTEGDAKYSLIALALSIDGILDNFNPANVVPPN